MTTDVSTVIDRLYNSFETGDAAAWEELLADDAVVIGTDPNEFWDDMGSAMTALRAQLNEMKDAGMKLEPGNRLTRNVGSGVTLFVDRPTLKLGDGGTVPLRLSIVIADVGSALTIKHIHLSVPAANEDVLDTALTT